MPMRRNSVEQNPRSSELRCLYAGAYTPLRGRVHIVPSIVPARSESSSRRPAGRSGTVRKKENPDEKERNDVFRICARIGLTPRAKNRVGQRQGLESHQGQIVWIFECAWVRLKRAVMITIHCISCVLKFFLFLPPTPHMCSQSLGGFSYSPLTSRLPIHVGPRSRSINRTSNNRSGATRTRGGDQQPTGRGKI